MRPALHSTLCSAIRQRLSRVHLTLSEAGRLDRRSGTAGAILSGLSLCAQESARAGMKETPEMGPDERRQESLRVSEPQSHL